VTGWIELATGAVPGSRGTLRLMRRGADFTITVGDTELMSNGVAGSEEALATLACARLGDRARPRVLIGGLGMGYTLRAALGALPHDAEIVVAELVPAVAEWARGPLAPIFAGCLDDPRVTLRVEDVNRAIQAGPGAYDAILLDVDNGPEGLTRRSNDRLYDRWGLRRARWALRADGVLAVWSGTPDRKFKARLRGEGFAVDEVRIRSVAGERRHVLWLAAPLATT
jgi:spermidine synthase